MKRLFVIGLLSTVMVGCGTTVTRALPGPSNSFTIMGESEFSYVDMVNDVYAAATRECSLRGEQMELIDVYKGNGGTGAFGGKQTFQLNYRCI